MPCTEGSGAAATDFDVRPEPDEPAEDELERRLPPRAATERPEPLRADALRRVVVERLLATGVTSTVAEEAAGSGVAGAAFAEGVVLAPADAWPEALAVADLVDAAAADAEERRRGAGVAMTRKWGG